jgi:hypothetical protein
MEQDPLMIWSTKMAAMETEALAAAEKLVAMTRQQ